jgi:hypothetical protein
VYDYPIYWKLLRTWCLAFVELELYVSNARPQSTPKSNCDEKNFFTVFSMLHVVGSISDSSGVVELLSCCWFKVWCILGI